MQNVHVRLNFGKLAYVRAGQNFDETQSLVIWDIKSFQAFYFDLN